VTKAVFPARSFIDFLLHAHVNARAVMLLLS